MKKTLLIVLGTLFTLAGSTFAHGSTYTGSTGTGYSGTGTNSGAVYLSICINDAALVQNTALLGINTTYVNSIKAASVKLQTAIDVAKASTGKTEVEIQAMIAAGFTTWRADVKAARTVASDAKKVAKTNFETAKAACKEKYKAYVEVKHDWKHEGKHDNRKDKDGKYENNKSKGIGLRISLLKKYSNKGHK